jgi:hypothetical protein
MSNRELTECELNGVAAGHYDHDNNGDGETLYMAMAQTPAPQQHPSNHLPTDPWVWLRKHR